MWPRCVMLQQLMAPAAMKSRVGAAAACVDQLPTIARVGRCLRHGCQCSVEAFARHLFSLFQTLMPSNWPWASMHQPDQMSKLSSV